MGADWPKFFLGLPAGRQALDDAVEGVFGEEVDLSDGLAG